MLWKGSKVPRSLGNIRKWTKKRPWRTRQSRSWRFSFHKYFTIFFYLFPFFYYFTLSFCFYTFFFTHDVYPHPHPHPRPTTHDPRPTTHDPRPTTSTHYPRPTTFSYTLGNDKWIILCNVGSRIMSGFEVIQEGGGLRRSRPFRSQEANKNPGYPTFVLALSSASNTEVYHVLLRFSLCQLYLELKTFGSFYALTFHA